MKTFAVIAALGVLLLARPACANQIAGALSVKAEVTGSCVVTIDNAKPVVSCVKGTMILLQSTSISLQQVTAMLAAFNDPPQIDSTQSYKVVTLYL